MERKEMNLFEKMLAITDEIGVVAKNLEVATGAGRSYKAVNERDVLDAVRPIEVKYGVYSYAKERHIITDEVLTKESTDRNGEAKKTNSFFMRVETVFEFVNVDNPEERITTVVYGDGIDTGDKAPGKAMTYSDKYALLKAYKISTGDDPDKDASPETGYEVKVEKASASQIKLIKELVTDITSMLAYCGVENIEDITKSQAAEIISKKLNKKNA
jgi:hypothetical protein